MHGWKLAVAVFGVMALGAAFILWRNSNTLEPDGMVNVTQETIVLAPRENLTDGSWRIATFTQAGEVYTFDDPRLTIAFSARRIAAQICSIFTGTVMIGTSTLEFSEFEQLSQSCDDEDRQKVDALFMKAETSKHRGIYSIDHNVLTIEFATSTATFIRLQ